MVRILRNWTGKKRKVFRRLSTQLFSKEYYKYLGQHKLKTVDDVYSPRKYNGKVMSDFDDYEDEVINEYKDPNTESG